MVESLSRRDFLVRCTALLPALVTGASSTASGAVSPATGGICLFEKPVQTLTGDELADFTVELGFDGIAATLRKGGRIAPERAEDELPRLVETLARRKLKVIELTTDIVRADQPHAVTTLRTAAKLGITRYRMGSLKYDLSKPVLPQLDEFQKQFNDLAAVNRELGIAGCYQVHAGASNVGAPVWDLHQLVKDHPVSVLGIAWDIRHATVEGGSCWPLNFQLARPHIGIVYAKDFVWKGRKAENVPLGEGQVDPKFYRMLTASRFTGPICLHTEYPLPEERKALATAIRKDLEFLRKSL